MGVNMSRSSFLIFVLLLGFGSDTFGAELRSELAQCRGIASLALRLQCYDRVVDGSPAGNVEMTVSPAIITPAIQQPVASTPELTKPVTAQKAPARVVSPESTKVKPEELFGKSGAEVAEAVSQELKIDSVDQIASKVIRIQINSTQEYVVYLENGQVWKQKDKAGKWRIKVGETAIISKASLGSFLMKSDARKKSVRAERLR